MRAAVQEVAVCVEVDARDVANSSGGEQLAHLAVGGREAALMRIRKPAVRFERETAQLPRVAEIVGKRLFADHMLDAVFDTALINREPMLRPQCLHDQLGSQLVKHPVIRGIDFGIVKTKVSGELFCRFDVDITDGDDIITRIL